MKRQIEVMFVFLVIQHLAKKLRNITHFCGIEINHFHSIFSRIAKYYICNSAMSIICTATLIIMKRFTPNVEFIFVKNKIDEIAFTKKKYQFLTMKEIIPFLDWFLFHFHSSFVYNFLKISTVKKN